MQFWAVSCICGRSVTEGQLPRTAAREQMSLARMEMIFRVGGADDYDYYNIFRVGGADNYDYYNILEWEEQTIEYPQDSPPQDCPPRGQS